MTADLEITGGEKEIATVLREREVRNEMQIMGKRLNGLREWEMRGTRPKKTNWFRDTEKNIAETK